MNFDGTHMCRGVHGYFENLSVDRVSFGNQRGSVSPKSSRTCRDRNNSHRESVNLISMWASPYTVLVLFFRRVIVSGLQTIIKARYELPRPCRHRFLLTFERSRPGFGAAFTSRRKTCRFSDLYVIWEQCTHWDFTACVVAAR